MTPTDRGSATVEWAVLFPVLLLLIFGLVQGGLWYHARQLALAAAQEGVRAGRMEGAAPGSAPHAAHAFATDHGQGLLLEPAASEYSSATEVRVRVSGQALSLVPGVPIDVSQEAAGARERFTTPS